ncbi:MAG TPA: hypothetical protein VGK48_19330 [Terriglobia bacterium]|jgi:hypothetical protein
MLLAGGFAFPVFAQVPVPPGRIAQQIIVNSQPANGAYVRNAAGGMQAFTCDSPQRYTTPDGSAQGWACYDQRTATFLLNALPPAQAQSAPRPAPLPAPSQAPLPQTPGVVRAPASPYPGYPAAGFPQPRLSGKVKIDTKRKDVMVYVDGGFAGRIKDLKKFSLPAGNHDIELRDTKGQTIFKEQVQVIPQETVEVRPTA